MKIVAFRRRSIAIGLVVMAAALWLHGSATVRRAEAEADARRDAAMKELGQRGGALMLKTPPAAGTVDIGVTYTARTGTEHLSSIVVWSGQQAFRGAEEPLRYVPAPGEAVHFTVSPRGDDLVTITRSASGAQMSGNRAAVLPRVSVASAQICVVLDRSACATDCSVSEARITADGHVYCADRFATDGRGQYSAPLRRCSGS